MNTYPRWQLPLVKQALQYARIVVLSGARQCGKTTLARMLASGEIECLTLDDGRTLEAARHDPREFIRHEKSTLIIDEFQRVRSTLDSYIEALRLLYLVEPVPPWTNTDYAQIGRQRKLFRALWAES